MQSLCRAGDFVGAAEAAGSLQGDVAAAAGVPPFAELAQMFQPSADDSGAVADAKVWRKSNHSRCRATRSGAAA